MLTALVLICSAAVTPDVRDCNARQCDGGHACASQVWKPWPHASLHGQAYLAETSIGEELGDSERVNGRVRANRNDQCVHPDADRKVILRRR